MGAGSAGHGRRSDFQATRGPPLPDARSNLSVGPPYDLAIYVPDSLEVQHHRIPEDSPLIEALRSIWARHVLQAITELPSVTDSELTVPLPDTLRASLTVPSI